MNKIALSPNSLIGVPALEYIDALVKAGYDGIGLRMYASPGVNYESVTQPIAGNPPLMRDIKSALDSSRVRSSTNDPIRAREHRNVSDSTDRLASGP